VNAVDSASLLRAELESVCEDAWCACPAINGQSLALWDCVWGDGCGVLGATFVAPPTKARIRRLATDSGRWWVWGARGIPRAVPLDLARATYGSEQVAPMDVDRAIATLRSLQPTLDDDGQRAIDFVAELVTQKCRPHG
jgi:hypothetical protein